jgi:hypothetical protein
MSASTHPKYVTNVVLDHGEHVGSSLNEHVVSDDGHPSPHHELPTLSDNLLRVPVNKHPVRPLLTRSRHHSAIPSARISQESIISQNSVRSSHQIYLDAPHINVSSPNCLPTSSFISLYHPAVSFYSLENNFSFASIDPSFYSAQESLDLDCHSHQPVVSIKDFLSAASHHQQSPLPTENISAEPGHDEPQLCNGSQGTESSKDPKSSSLEDSADESFQCRGLSSSQITPDSRYQLSDQTPSQFPSDQDNSQPSSEQRGYHSTDKKHDQVRHVVTDKHGIIDHCQQSNRIPNKNEVNSLASTDDDHSEVDSHNKIELSRRRVSNSKDEVAIGQPKRSGSLSSEASSATPNPMRTVIPASIDLDENAGIFRCPTLRRLIVNFGPGIISLNDKRKKLQEELHEKIRAKFHRD